MKENNNDLDENPQQNEKIEDEDLLKINEMLKLVNNKKEEGNKLVSIKKYEEAEKVYQEALNIINKFETKKKFQMDSEENKQKGKEIILTIKNLYSNLALCQGKQLKIHDAIETSTYIISNLDSYHDKSYLRIMMWMIEMNELDAAEEIKKEIENKFQGEKLKIFNSAFNLLKIKKEDIEEKIKNKIKKLENNNNTISINEIINNESEINTNNNKIEENYYSNFISSIINRHKYITIGIGGLIGAIALFLLYKYKNK
jgi:tetratricopeptide (TPR) repeat protein